MVGSLFVPFAFIGGAAHAKIVASHDNLEKEGLEKSATASFWINYPYTKSTIFLINVTVLCRYLLHDFFSFFLRWQWKQFQTFEQWQVFVRNRLFWKNIRMR